MFSLSPSGCGGAVGPNSPIQRFVFGKNPPRQAAQLASQALEEVLLPKQKFSLSFRAWKRAKQSK